MTQPTSPKAPGYFELLDNCRMRVVLTEPYEIACTVTAVNFQFADKADIMQQAASILGRLYGITVLVNSNKEAFETLYAAFTEVESAHYDKFAEQEFQSKKERNKYERKMKYDIDHAFIDLFKQHITDKGIATTDHFQTMPAFHYQIMRFLKQNYDFSSSIPKNLPD